MRWEIVSSTNYDYITRRALELGWAEKKVQLKKYETRDGPQYGVEPFEIDCRCPNLIKYEDYLEGLNANSTI